MNENESSEIETEYQCVEQNVTSLLNKLKIEYGKLLKLQTIRNKDKLSITYNRNKLKMWDDFEALWVHWDILSFVEWLKRIKYQYVKSFYGYWQTDNQCINKIENYIQSNPQRFGIIHNENQNDSFFQHDINQKLTFKSPPNRKKKRQKSSQSQSILIASKRRQFLDSLKLGNSRSYPVFKQNDNDINQHQQEEKDGCDNNEEEDDKSVFKGEYLEYFDRYILDKVGIINELDCDIIFNEINRLKRKYPNISAQIENDKESGTRHDDRQCNVCCERNTTHILQCGHHFCEFCIDEFRKTTNRCAICKGKITMVIKMY